MGTRTLRIESRSAKAAQESQVRVPSAPPSQAVRGVRGLGGQGISQSGNRSLTQAGLAHPFPVWQNHLGLGLCQGLVFPLLCLSLSPFHLPPLALVLLSVGCSESLHLSSFLLLPSLLPPLTTFSPPPGSPPAFTLGTRIGGQMTPRVQSQILLPLGSSVALDNPCCLYALWFPHQEKTRVLSPILVAPVAPVPN